MSIVTDTFSIGRVCCFVGAFAALCWTTVWIIVAVHVVHVYNNCLPFGEQTNAHYMAEGLLYLDHKRH